MTEGQARKGFDLDLADGLAVEGILEDALKGAKIEVKRDYQWHKTGNLFLEYESRGAPGGIAVTEAEVWAWALNDDCFVLMPTELLKKVARELWEERRVLGGDDNTSKGILVPLDALLDAMRERN